MTEWLDLCNTQTVVDVAKLQSKVDGCIIKLGYTGYGSNKPALSPGWNKHFNALKGKVDLGVYYFTIAYTDAMVDMETEWVIRQLKEAEKDGFKFTLPIFVDCEAQKNSAGWTNLDKTTRSRLMKRWMDNMRKAGYYTGIYAGVTTWKKQTILVTPMLEGYDKWMAQYYTVNQYVNPSTGQPGVAGVDYTAWQYTSEVADAASYGIATSKKDTKYGLDVSHCYVDYPSIIKNGGWNGFTKPVEIPTEDVTLRIKAGNFSQDVTINKGDTITIERV